MVEFISAESARRLGYEFIILDALAQTARSKCLHRHVGAVVLNQNGIVIGRGANMPPNFNPPEVCNKLIIPKIGGPNDRHCCLHAEHIALLDAITHHTLSEVQGSTLFFVDASPEGKIVPVKGKPYCTQCSKVALYLGVRWWVCYHAAGVWPEGEGFYRYTAQEYNTLSFAYRDSETSQLEGEVHIATHGVSHYIEWPEIRDEELNDILLETLKELEGKHIRITIEEVK